MKTKFGICFCVLFAAAVPAAAQQAASRPGGMSRSMEQAIRLYHEGQDTDAMDRFMEILTKGTPSEKSLANEYIGKITLRLNTGIGTLKDKGDSGALNDVEEVRQEPGKAQYRYQEQLSSEEAAEAEQAESKITQKERITRRINLKISEMRRKTLLELNRHNSIKIYMGDDVPKAVSLNTAQIFANETVFRPGAAPVLSGLAGLIFTMGKANCMILPEGSAQNDVKIKSIRQALALNSYLVSRGLSPARIDVNLTGSDIKLPKELNNISGLIILFSYNVPQRLKDPEDLPSKGPKISLGLYPTAISTRYNEGSIVEFSVFEPATGTPSWKFQIFQVQDDNNILLLQEISGTGSQYNQSFWNGRKNFFGAAYPSGKYMFALTAADVGGREAVVRRLLAIRPTPEEEKAMEAKKALPAAKKLQPAAAPKAGKQGKLLKGAPSGTGKTLIRKGGAARRAPAAAAKGGKKTRPGAGLGKEAASGDEAEPPSGTETAAGGLSGAGGQPGTAQGTGTAAEGEAQSAFSGQVSYKIYFKENSAIVTSNSEKKLSQVAETLNYYPMSKAQLTGYAYSGEPNAGAMAANRVNHVVARLSEKYKIDRERIDAQTKISDTPKALVEIKLEGKE